MSTPTAKEIREAIAAHERGGGVEAAVSDWMLSLFGGFFERWPCEDDNCPARPDWDKRLSAIFEVEAPKIEDECMRLIESRLEKIVRAFVAEHPEAVVAKEEAAA